MNAAEKRPEAGVKLETFKHYMLMWMLNWTRASGFEETIHNE